MAKKHRTIHEVAHPLLLHKITHMRRPVKDCPSRLFTQLMREAGMIMASEVMRDFPTRDKEIITQRAIKEQRGDESFIGVVLKDKKPVIVPILRSGLVMAEGVREVISTTYTGHIGIFHPIGAQEAESYLVSLPETIDRDSESLMPDEKNGVSSEIKDRKIFLVDPVIVSGKTASLAIDIICEYGVPEDHIHFLTLILGKDGEDEIMETHPDAHIHTAVRGENVEDYDLDPGLGMISNRLFRTV